MNTIALARSALFVPGNRPERVDKAAATAADLVIIDLEDAVPESEKDTVRPLVREKIDQHRNRNIMVRVNALDTGRTEADLAGIIGPALHSVMLPKVQAEKDVLHIAELMSAAEEAAGLTCGKVALVALIETALGVEHAFAIAKTVSDPPRLATLAFGAADFTLDMGISITKTGEELAFARARIALACRAAGIEPPLDTPYMIDLADRQAFENDAMRGKVLGFGGKLCIHPNQIDFVNQLFSPSEEEISFAVKAIAAFKEAEANGRAAIQVDGKFVDYPVVYRARRILKIAEARDRKL